MSLARRSKLPWMLWGLFLALAVAASARNRHVDRLESKVPPVTLPDPLRLGGGSKVDSPQVWWQQRRPEILRLFEQHVYGRVPHRVPRLRFEVRSIDRDALDGRAVRKQIRGYFTDDDDGPRMDLLLYLPKDAPRPVPVFAGLNFLGNQSVHRDPGIELTTRWLPGPLQLSIARRELGIVENRATEASRGSQARQWQLELLLRRGYGLATVYYGDFDPDHDDAFQNGVQPLFYEPGQTGPGPAEWGSIGAWAWGLSRILDYLETDSEVDAERVALVGHSRLGKAALWAGALDQRFALVIANGSGCGGAALSRRRFGERVAQLNAKFPHWFCANFKRYNGREERLPVDQHMLLALIAPRPLYLASASGDFWADPRGEFLSARHASAVYRLLGVEGLGASVMPAPQRPVLSRVGFHLRHGKHDVTRYDWMRFLEFAERWMSASSVRLRLD